MYYYIINKQTNKALNIYGAYLLELSDHINCTTYSHTGSNEQLWRIDSISSTSNCYVRSYINEVYGLNVNRRQSAYYYCDVYPISGNETDAAVRFISQGGNYYKIKLANYDKYLSSTGTSENSISKWLSSDSSDAQIWSLVQVDLAQRAAEKDEYHLISQSGNGNALYVYGYTTSRLSSDTDLQIRSMSYCNRQKWTIKGTGNAKKIYTQHGDNFVLCNNGSNTAIVSATTTDANSNLTITPYGSSGDLYEIKLTSSGLYLTLSGNSIVWASYSSSNHTDQVWKMVGKPSNIHNGGDTSSTLTDTTVRALKLGKEEFVFRYYTTDASSWKALTSSEVTYLHNRGLKIVSVFQDNGSGPEYFSSSLGTSNATAALARASALGQPTGTAIYFAVDYDAAGSLANIEAYFRAIKTKFNGQYKIGVYGSGEVCERIKQSLGYADYSFLAMSTGWTNYQNYDSISKYNVKQAEPIVYNGVTFDDNIAVGSNYGQW